MISKGASELAHSQPQMVLAISQTNTMPMEPEAPVTDFQQLAAKTGAAVVGNGGKADRFASIRTLENKVALDVSQAVSIVRDFPNADAYVSFSERVGLPLGMLLRSRRRRPAHVLIAHRLDTRPKKLMESLAGWRRGVDEIVTLCTEQLKAARRFLPDSSALVKAGSTDDSFYRPRTDEDEGYILSAGSESRDYPTLVAAAQRAGLHLKVLSSSPWCRKGIDLSASGNTSVEFLPRVSYSELRELYWRARVVALPLLDVSYVAGLNGLLEGFCANKPVVVSASRGIADYVQHMENAYVVPVGDVDAMTEALRAVHTDAALRERLVSGAKEAVGSYANLESFTTRLQSEILQAVSKDRSI